MHVEQLKGRFRDGVDTIKGGPTQERTTRDACCYLFFVLAMLAFIVLGIFVMADQSSSISQAISDPSSENSSNVLAVVFSKYPGLIAVMFLIAIGIAVLYMLLVRYCLRCVIYTMVVCVFCIMFAILIMAISSNNFGLIVAMSIGMFLFLVFILCMRSELELGMLLMESASRFISQRPSVYLAGIWVFFLSCLFFIFWVVSVVAVQMRANTHISQGTSTSGELGILGYFFFIYIFMTIFLYYILTFLIATACALWYYNIDGGYFCVATGRINRYHIGSFTFAALLLTLVRLLQAIINSKGEQSENACARCIQCFISCILSQVEYLLRVLNSTSVVVMAVTGQGYCDAAKTAAYLLFDRLPLYSAVSVISNLVMIGGAVVAVGIPTIVALLYAKKHYTISDQELDHLGLIIFFGTVILVVFIIGTLCEALNSIFVFHCLNLRLNEAGCIMETPDLLREIGQTKEERAAHSAQQLQEKSSKF